MDYAKSYYGVAKLLEECAEKESYGGLVADNPSLYLVDNIEGMKFQIF